MKAEQSEALIRVPVVIVGWILMDLWGVVATFVAVIHWLYALATAKRHKGMASFNNTFVAYMYAFVRYALFTTNKRPFPWNEFGKPVEKVDMKKKA